MYKFADYGFNKSHAAAYSVITAQTAWLKNYYPAEFFAALLSTEIGDTDKVVKYVKDAQKRNLNVKPPHINFSDYLFSVTGDQIYFGLGAIKGVGESAVQAILEAREALPNKKFEGIDDFFNSVDLRRVNKKVIECLIKAGAFDGFGPHRAQLLEGYPKFLDRALGVQKDRESGQTSLFEMDTSVETVVSLPEVKPWPRTACLAYEKEVLGFYLSDHPLKGFDTLAELWTSAKIADLPKLAPSAEETANAKIAADKAPKKDWRENRNAGKKRVIISGLITELRELITKKGTRMAFGKIEDLSGACELVIFPDAFAKFEMTLKDERPLLVAGFLEVEEGSAKIMVDNISPLDDIFRKARQMVLKLQMLQPQDYDKLHTLLKEHPGNTGVSLEIEISDINRKVQIEAEGIGGVQISSEFFEGIHLLFGRTDFIELRGTA